MSTFLKYAILATISIGVTFAQVYTYANASSDGTNLYVTGVMDGNGWPGTNFQHTYTVDSSLTSPNGRYSSSYCGGQYSSGSYFNVSCGAALPIIEEGSYSADITETAVCSFAGLFIDWPDLIQIDIRYTTTFYTNNDGGTIWCTYHSLACTSGTPTCGVIPAPVGVGIFFPPCPAIARSSWLVVNGICDVHFDFAATNGGTCN